MVMIPNGFGMLQGALAQLAQAEEAKHNRELRAEEEEAQRKANALLSLYADPEFVSVRKTAADVLLELETAKARVAQAADTFALAKLLIAYFTHAAEAIA